MIIVEVENYCQKCPDFEPDVEKPVRLYTDSDQYTLLGDTVIRCEYRRRCEAISYHIKNINCGHGGACYIRTCGENGNIDKKE